MLNSKSYKLTSFVLYTVLNISLINSLALCCTQQYPLTGVSSLWCPFLLANSTSTYFNLKTKTYLSLYMYVQCISILLEERIIFHGFFWHQFSITISNNCQLYVWIQTFLCLHLFCLSLQQKLYQWPPPPQLLVSCFIWRPYYSGCI